MLTIPLPADLEAKVRERAAASGKDIVTYVAEAVQEKVEAPQTFAEILAPVHEAFRSQGLTQEHMTRVFEKAREELFQEQQGKKSS